MCVLFWLIYITAAFPSDSTDSISTREFIMADEFSVQKSSESKEQNTNENETNDDYDAKMADIFDIPLDDRRVNLDNCTNIMCMPHYLCINDMVVTNGTELFEWRISMRINDAKPNIVCGDLEMPCCADQAMKNLHQIQSNESAKTEIMSGDNTNNDKTSDDYEENTKDDENTISNVIRCGERNEGNHEHPSTRIIDGDDALPNEFPWMVGLFMRLPNNDLRYIGGGSLIHKSVIMTAAHLIRRIVPEKLVVRAGEHDILDKFNNGQRQERNITNIIIHEDIYAQGLINDIALIVTNKPFELTNAVNTVCLPPQSIETDEHVMCISSGWGKNAGDRNGNYQATLKKVDLPVVERGKCEHLLRRTRLGPFYNLNESLMCAGGSRRDTCKGDGGSPLICEIPQEKGRFYQSGIVAGGIGCGGKIPGLYVNVAHFSNWITHQLGFIDLNFEPENVLHYELFDY